MNAKKFSAAMSELDTKYVDEALNHKKKAKRPGWIKWGAMAACLCLVVYAGIRLIPTDSPPDESSELPLLNAQFEGGDMGFEGLMLFDISESGSANPWTKDMVLETLPVYENLAYTDASGLPVYLSENELLGVAEDIATRLNADIISTEYKRVEDTAQLSPNTCLLYTSPSPRDRG